MDISLLLNPVSPDPAVKMAEATRRAMSIVEILEQILLQLHFNDISHCIRVCKQFQAVIVGSRALQKALWRVHDEFDGGPMDVSNLGPSIQTQKPVSCEILIR